ncbi:MAG: PAS domain-containing protein [Polyangiaceae bacterium]
MQSMNEELQTVNHELQSKVEELSRSNNDMKNLLNSTDIATLFLDGDLLVRRFTTQTSKLIKLIPADTGRPITDLATDLEYPDLAEDAREVLRSLVFKEKSVATRDGRWFTVRIMPYRTLENMIDGVVITFTDATGSRSLESSLRDTAAALKQMTESLPNLVWWCRPDGACDYVSRRWLEYTGVSEAEQLGFGWFDQVHAEDREGVRDQWRKAVRTGVQLDAEFRIRHKSGSYRWFKGTFAPIRDKDGRIGNWYCTSTDVDDLKRVAERLASALDGIEDAFVGTDERLVVTDVNDVAERLFDRKRADVLGKRLFEAYPASAVTEDKLRRAIRQKRPLAYDGEVEKEGEMVAIRVRVFPRAGGVSMFSRRAVAEGKAASARSEG